jgi:hypothetical protein
MTTDMTAAAPSVLEMDVNSANPSPTSSPRDHQLEDVLASATLEDVVEHDVDGEDILASTADPTRPNDYGKAGTSRMSSDAYSEILAKALEHTTACSTCPTAFLLEDESDDVSQVVLPLLRDLRKDNKARAVALQKLYQMTDRERQRNRYVEPRIACS